MFPCLEFGSMGPIFENQQVKVKRNMIIMLLIWRHKPYKLTQPSNGYIKMPI